MDVFRPEALPPQAEHGNELGR